MSSAMGTNKVFILDKYFNELQKFWDTEKRLQDATSSGEAVNLQTKLKSLSSELVTLRSRLHVPGEGEQAKLSLEEPPLPSPGRGYLDTTADNPPPPLQFYDQQSLPRSTKYFAGGVNAGLQNSLHNSFRDFSTLQSGGTNMTGSLQHNYSNIQTGISAPSSIVSAVSIPSLSSFPPPVPSSLPPSEGTIRTIASAPRTPPSERQRRREKFMIDEMKKSRLADVDDLIRLEGPLTEDAVLKTLQSRFYNRKYQTNIGPILVHVNPYTDLKNPITLNSTLEAARTSQLRRVAEEAIRIQGDTGYPQAIILSGACGSGKTYASMVLLRQLFDLAGGGPETDAFKHLAAAFTVLRSLGSAKTAANRESSRIGYFIEVQVSEGALYRTKIHCYFLDQSRVIRPQPMEKNYHIFYQLMAGLTGPERRQLGLAGYTIRDLRYLNCGDTRTDEVEDAARFEVWKGTLGILGIPYMDVLRVLATILLLGNIEFVEGEGLEVEIIGTSELESVSGLLGISPQLLIQGLTTKTHNVRGQLVKSSSDANMSNATRDALAKALYCRTVATIVKRANSLKKPMGSGSMSSNESVHHEVASLHASTVGTAGSKKSSKSLAILNNALRHATDGFIGVLDMFGFEDSKPSQLEQLCINLCSETMQHFFNTHTLKTSIETCKDEGISCDVVVDYNDNAHCIDLISSLRTGLLRMLDVECSVRGCPETYVQKLKVQHKDNTRLFEPPLCDVTRTFGIQHYTGKVVYDATDFLDTNRDVIPDDLVSIFHKQSCAFGFVTHLFGTEIKALYSEEIVPRGITFRISPTSYSELLNGDEPVSTLTQDFHTRLDNLLRTLVHAKPHFVRCIRPNETESSSEFKRGFVVEQVRSLQILETVNLMAGGFPHRMRFKNFNSRYRTLAPIRTLSRSDDQALEDCQRILDHLKVSLKSSEHGAISKDWALGKKHIFLSEGARQHLEKLRTGKRAQSARQIQAIWRGYSLRKKWPSMRSTLQSHLIAQKSSKTSRPRPQPITGTPPPDASLNGLFLVNSKHPLGDRGSPNILNSGDRCDFKTIQKTCSLFGLDLERPPPVPPSRSYTVRGNSKIAYPQARFMRQSYPDEKSGDTILLKGEQVLVVGASTRRGHLVVEKYKNAMHVPFQYLELNNLG